MRVELLAGEGCHVTGENRVVKQLRGVASKLTSDPELQKDLLQEMFVHLVKVRTELPARTSSWYIKSCEFRARNYLKHGRSVDSIKRARNCVPLGQLYDDPDGQVYCFVEAMDPVDLQSELYTKDIVDLVTLQLSDTQQQIFFLLMKGFRVREIARELHMSHPAVIKHRKKIARIANEFIEDRTELSVASDYSNISGSNSRYAA
jgi:RNA polymerase sigma factor (sigma-70 family)